MALAGRRIDATDATPPRFPSVAIAAVEARLAGMFREECAAVLVCSAACGADILALEVAVSLGLQTRLVLPFAAAVFRSSSVIDRGNAWGPRFDRVLEIALQRQDVVTLNQCTEPADAYEAANVAILAQASELAEAMRARKLAVTVWDGVPRASRDGTAAFATVARRLGWQLRELSTL